MDNHVSFLSSIDNDELSYADRARALLWLTGRADGQGMSIPEICKVIEAVGHPRQNPSRLKQQLSADKKRVSRVPGQKGWRLHPRGRAELDLIYGPLIGAPRRPAETASVLPDALFVGTRGYLSKVVFQINASYDATLYDCTAVMCRRLLETLIIEVYEAASRANNIKNRDGNFFMFADLLRIFEGDLAFNISRNGAQGLRDFKKLGDLSAHNRRFNAGRNDIDRVRDGIRVAAEELLHMAKLA